MPKTVAQSQKKVLPYLCTLKRTIAYALPNAIAYLNTCIPYLNTCITYLNTLTRLSAPYLNTLPTRLGNTREPSAANQNRAPESSANQNRVLRNPSRQAIRIAHRKNPSIFSANQNRVLRNPSRQPIKIEHYVTRELSARVEDPSRLSARFGSL